MHINTLIEDALHVYVIEEISCIYLYAPGVMEVTESTVAEGTINKDIRLKMWTIIPVVVEMVPWKDERRSW